MKKLIFGVVATACFSLNGFASVNPVKSIITEEIKNKKEMTTQSKSTKEDVSCTACVNISIGGSGGSLCATAQTCKQAIAKIKAAL